MINIPQEILARYDEILIEKSVPSTYHGLYKKWLRYYLDFCHKYEFRASRQDSLTHFVRKLSEKHQSQAQQKQAKQAIALYYAIRSSRAGIKVKTSESESRWGSVHKSLYSEIKLRHYSPKTYQAYSKWVRGFQSFLQGKDPDLLLSPDVKKYLEYLAIRKKVSASTQNQAFNSLLFLFRHVLKRELGDLKDTVRAASLYPGCYIIPLNLKWQLAADLRRSTQIFQ